MKILCHVGPWSDAYLYQVCKGIDPDADVLLASGHKSVDQSGVASRYYHYLSINKNKKYCNTDKDEDFIMRCRLLRSICPGEAALHLNSMRDAVVELFDSFKPDLLVSETIDSFLMDIFFDEAKKRGVRSIGLVSCFVNGYFRVSSRGEYNHLRVPDEQEVISVLKMIEDKSYAPAFISEAREYPFASIIKRWIRNTIKPPYFWIKRQLSSESYNYHYWATQLTAQDWFHLFPRLWLGDENWRQKLEKINKPVIYVPLQMIPEATVDYWCEDSRYIDYENVLLRFISKFSNNFHFLIKEHPNVLGFRNPRLYKKLAILDNVTICPTNVNSNAIGDYYQAVLVWTGSVGFEAALRGKPVIAFCRPYYAIGSMFMVIGEYTTAESIREFITSNNGIRYAEQLDMVRHLLSSVMPGKLQVSGDWREDNKRDVESAMNLGKQLQQYLLSASE